MEIFIPVAVLVVWLILQVWVLPPLRRENLTQRHSASRVRLPDRLKPGQIESRSNEQTTMAIHRRSLP